MDTLLQQLLNGVVVGSVYVLVALGLTLMFGILDIPNFAHGQVYMIGAFVTYYMITNTGLNFFVAMAVSMIATAILGIGIERVFFRPVREAGGDAALISALAVAILIESVALRVFGEYTRITPFEGGVYNLLGVTISKQRLMIILVSIVAIILLQMFIKRTRLGKAMRATAENRQAAALMGIDIDSISSVTFAIGSALAGIAGALLGTMFSVFPGMGGLVIMKAFVIIVLGGFGSIVGAILGGYALGLGESLGGGYISSNYQDTFAFLILVLVLLIKPTGLFGERKREA